MPHANIWVRKDDWEAWESIEDKPAFIHRSIINYGMGEDAPEAVKDRADEEIAMLNKVDELADSIELADRITAEEIINEKKITSAMPVAVCKIHGTPLSKFGGCLQKGCKYA
jgi:hypothetical protein